MSSELGLYISEPPCAFADLIIARDRAKSKGEKRNCVWGTAFPIRALFFAFIFGSLLKKSTFYDKITLKDLLCQERRGENI